MRCSLSLSGVSRSLCLAALALAAFLPLAVTAGCTGPQSTVDAKAVDGTLRPVLDRHDRYVTADTSLSAVEKTTDLRSSALIRATLDAALQKRPAPAATSPALPSAPPRGPPPSGALTGPPR